MTWIGGQIVNPKSDYVVLLKDNEVMDTIKLDSQNFFHYQSECIKPGLYSFRHHEYQIFYLEPGDSLMLRVNTVDFDESLTYSGTGAARNNLLMDLFLMNESENTLMPSLYRLKPVEFEAKIDSLRALRMELFNDYAENQGLCSDFKKVALANIDYDYYSKKELYTSANVTNQNLKPEDFPEDFYDYRKEIDFGNKELRAYYPYYRFLNRYFDNLAHSKNDNSGNYLNRNSFNHSYEKIKIIDSLVECEILKNSLLYTCARRYLINAKDIENEKQMVAIFNKTNTNPEHHEHIEKLAATTMQLTPGNILPNVMLVNYDNVMKDVHSIVNKPTVLYFWSAESVKHFRNLHSRAAELKSKYPEYDFKGINTDTHFKKWKEVVYKSGYNTNHEYQLDNVKDAEQKLLINSMNKAIIVDKNGIILDGHSNLFSPTIEENLLGYLNL
ncbi:hypothetical protein C5O00_10665 [Pukyongia salina]|uniref:Thioredoxin domain-containing protein n=2 Tax=Pukyongia salina TaxID=2094025 RepID=A0A2S0HY34_9FLAO|nr:hypothetical protein C5O00_10665 [Pukyongia salina]